MDRDGELVKYMSSLPSFLGTGVNVHESSFSVGVLDWGNLEKWQHKKKAKLRRNRGPSTSRGELSSSFWNGGLPSNPAGHGNADARRRNCLDNRTSGKNEPVRSDGLAHSPKAKVKVRGSAKGKRISKLEISSGGVLEKQPTGRPKLVAVRTARGVQNDLSERSASCTNISRMGLEEASPRSLLEKHRASGVSSKIPHSYVLPDILDGRKHLLLRQCSSFYSRTSTCIFRKHDAEAAPASGFSETSKSKEMSRCQSSSHKKLLHPTSKGEEIFSFQHIEPLPQSSVSVDNACKASNFPHIRSSRLKCCRSVDVSNSQLGKGGMSAGQALLRVALKNGRLLFTFAVNAESGVLAASTKKSGGTSRKSSSKWSYTLFKIPAAKRGMRSKKKGGKIGPHHGYPLMLSQLNVSELHHSKSSIQREFVLFPAGRRNVELAAIVVQIPSIVGPNTVLRSYDSEPSQVGPEGPSLDRRSRLEDGQNIQGQLLTGNGSCISATVILPGGVHSLPSKGEPSSLIERWKSGGSCDCGGWDLDCELRVLRSSEACDSSSADKLAVFAKVGEEDDQAVLSLSTSKDGTYSVEFNSSISELQAFSICIAVLDCGSISQ